MFGLSKKEKWVRALSYYIIDDELYKFLMHTNVSKNDVKLSNTDIFNKYGVHVSKYRIDFKEFEDWNYEKYNSLNDVPFDMTKAKDITEYGLAWGVDYIKNDFKKKFDDFQLDGKIYSCKEYHETEQCFPSVVKPKMKLINEGEKNIIDSLILEIEILDGNSAATRREFIPFIRFINQYEEGCAVKVVDSGYPFKLEDYFESYIYEDLEPLPF
jgi:hypothetical protein